MIHICCCLVTTAIQKENWQIHDNPPQTLEVKGILSLAIIIQSLMTAVIHTHTHTHITYSNIHHAIDYYVFHFLFLDILFTYRITWRAEQSFGTVLSCLSLSYAMCTPCWWPRIWHIAIRYSRWLIINNVICIEFIICFAFGTRSSFVVC